MMTHQYQHLGPFSDWPEAAGNLSDNHKDDAAHLHARKVLSFGNGPEIPIGVRQEKTWRKDGISGEEISWSVGYGPRTHAYFLKPENADSSLPGVVALHDHGAYKYFGKEKIAEANEGTPAFLQSFRDIYYGGRAWPNELAKRGYAVLVHDTFLWGSRRWPLEAMPDNVISTAEILTVEDGVTPREILLYNRACADHENIVQKYCNILDTSMAAIVSHEDRIAVNYLKSRADVESTFISCAGLSGGGMRSVLLNASSPDIKAAIVVGAMSTYTELLARHVASHTWMFFPTNWSRYGDWPDLAACRAPSPLLVQNDIDDDLYSMPGMQKAHERMSDLYRQAGAAANYRGEFYPGAHKFDREMQENAFAWLAQWK